MVFLVRKPKVKSLILTEAYSDGTLPLIVRFKLNSGICTDFIQIFVDRVGGTAKYGEDYFIEFAEGLRIITSETDGELDKISFAITDTLTYFDLKIIPVQKNSDVDKTIILKVQKAQEYIADGKEILLTIRRSRFIILGNDFFIKNVYSPKLGEYYNYPQTEELTLESQNIIPQFQRAGENFLSESNIDPQISLFINYDENLFPGISQETPLISFSQSSYSHIETSFIFGTPLATIIREGTDLSATSTFRINISEATAEVGIDFLKKFPIYITFQPGQTTYNLPGSIISDGLTEGLESFVLELSPHINSSIGTISTATINIYDS